MRQQSQIQRALGCSEGIARITALLRRERFSSRSDLGRRVCEEFDCWDRLGRPQQSGCLNALRVIERRCDSIVPPVAGMSVPRAGRPSLLAEGVRRAKSVPGNLSEPRRMRVWNTLIANWHPGGVTTFAGAKTRYLSRLRVRLAGRSGLLSRGRTWTSSCAWTGSWSATAVPI